MDLAANASLRNVFTKFVLNIGCQRCVNHDALHIHSDVGFKLKRYVASYIAVFG